MKKAVWMLLLFMCYGVQAQVNLPIEKSPYYRLNQKIETVRDHTKDVLDEGKRGIPKNDSLMKLLEDSIYKAESEKIEKIKNEARESFKFPYRAQIIGLGNIAASQAGDQISPSANIYATILPYKSPNFKISFLFNIGINADSSNIDSLKLGTIFFPDKNKTGFGFRIGYDLFPLIKNWFAEKRTSELLSLNVDSSGYIIRDNIEPYIEYSYSKFNFRNANPDSSNLQTGTLLFGLSYVHSWEKGDNTLGFIITPYYKLVKVTDGTYTLYKKIFSPTVAADKNPQTVKFLGINTSLQVNRFLFSFIYESLKTKNLSGTPLYGGVFTIKASVTGDFIRL